MTKARAVPYPCGFHMRSLDPFGLRTLHNLRDVTSTNAINLDDRDAEHKVTRCVQYIFKRIYMNDAGFKVKGRHSFTDALHPSVQRLQAFHYRLINKAELQAKREHIGGTHGADLPAGMCYIRINCLLFFVCTFEPHSQRMGRVWERQCGLHRLGV